MFNMGSAPSLSDIAAVTKDGNGDGWGNGNGEGWKNDISHHRPKPCNYFHVEELILCTPYESSYP